MLFTWGLLLVTPHIWWVRFSVLVSPHMLSGMWFHAVYEHACWIPFTSLAQTNLIPMELCTLLPTKLQWGIRWFCIDFPTTSWLKNWKHWILVHYIILQDKFCVFYILLGAEEKVWVLVWRQIITFYDNFHIISSSYRFCT